MMRMVGYSRPPGPGDRRAFFAASMLLQCICQRWERQAANNIVNELVNMRVGGGAELVLDLGFRFNPAGTSSVTATFSEDAAECLLTSVEDRTIHCLEKALLAAMHRTAHRGNAE